MKNTMILLNAAAIKVAAAAKSVNRHVDAGDFNPNMGKVLMIDSTFKMELTGMIERLKNWGMTKEADYANTLLRTAMEIRTKRKAHDFRTKIDWVAPFPFAA